MRSLQQAALVDGRAPVPDDQMAAITAGVAAAILAQDAPSPEARTASAGAQPFASRMDHQHPRLTSAQYATTGAGGLTPNVMFTRSFASMPCAILCPINNQGVSCDVASWIQDANGNYIGAVIRATKRTTINTIAKAVVATISVVTGADAVTNDAPVSGALISIVMLAQS